MAWTRKLGRFYIALDVIETKPALALAIMGNVIVVRAELLYESNRVEYMAVSDLFKVVPMTEEVPVYSFVFKGQHVIAVKEESG